jgi:hypothetical protein
MLRPIPLAQRRGDLIFIAFFIINFVFITYQVDLEQLVVADPLHFSYPPWPPRAVIDLVHWWGRTFDPPLMAREPWWRATIWIDVLGFGPFYLAAIYAFIKGRDWIKIPAIIWAAMLFTNVVVILFEEFLGAHPTPRPGVIFAANLAWLLYPPFMIWRMARRERPFTVEES